MQAALCTDRMKREFNRMQGGSTAVENSRWVSSVERKISSVSDNDGQSLNLRIDVNSESGSTASSKTSTRSLSPAEWHKSATVTLNTPIFNNGKQLERTGCFFDSEVDNYPKPQDDDSSSTTSFCSGMSVCEEDLNFQINENFFDNTMVPNMIEPHVHSSSSSNTGSSDYQATEMQNHEDLLQLVHSHDAIMSENDHSNSNSNSNPNPNPNPNSNNTANIFLSIPSSMVCDNHRKRRYRHYVLNKRRKRVILKREEEDISGDDYLSPTNSFSPTNRNRSVRIKKEKNQAVVIKKELGSRVFIKEEVNPPSIPLPTRSVSMTTTTTTTTCTTTRIDFDGSSSSESMYNHLNILKVDGTFVLRELTKSVNDITQSQSHRKKLRCKTNTSIGGTAISCSKLLTANGAINVVSKPPLFFI